MTVEGIDIANYQTADPTPKGAAFTVVKATEGTGYRNPKYAAQLKAARARGLAVGHYHFARPGPPTAQVDYFLAHADLREGEFIAYDWEDTGVSCADKDAWLKYVKGKQPGHRLIMYSNRDFWLHRDTTSYCADGLLIADPSAPKGHPRVQHPWLFHQYSEAGGLDRDLGNFHDRAALDAWLRFQEDDMPLTPADIKAIWDYQLLSPTSKQTHPAGVFLRYGDDHFARLAAQIGALTATVTALAKGGGLTAAEITTAAEAGARAALAELGTALTPDTKES